MNTLFIHWGLNASRILFYRRKYYERGIHLNMFIMHFKNTFKYVVEYIIIHYRIHSVKYVQIRSNTLKIPSKETTRIR